VSSERERERGERTRVLCKCVCLLKSAAVERKSSVCVVCEFFVCACVCACVCVRGNDASEDVQSGRSRQCVNIYR